ncbi:hypothetical protein RHGRI_027214 [Rhododendron griersonianum]|uniref:F-box associated beta-propeller type 1 domain-containing protein n=1 Tax=Rhododendron griersonianum TaxID=479676 RepID=A0AAV6J0I2_9ERIC|nr:hypothetical protein RHGRI_027214 [Rhododendron griersonianum]
MEIPRPKPLQFAGPKPLQFAGCLRIGGSCNGLVLLNSREDLFMWNPFIGCCKKVLSIEFLKQYSDSSIMDVSGLCYDSSTDDYKVVIMGVRDGETGMACMVGSCRTKSWTKNCDPYYRR